MEVPHDRSMYDKLYKVRPVVEQMNRFFPLYYKGSAQFCPTKPGARFIEGVVEM